MFDRLLEVSQDIVTRIEHEGDRANSLKETLLDELKKVYGEQAATRYEMLSAFFERVDMNHQEIIEGKANGRSTESWLKGKLAENEANHPGLTEVVMKEFGRLSAENEESTPVVLDVKNDFDFGIMTHHVKQGIEIGSLSQVLSIDAVMEKVMENVVPEGFIRLTDALKSDLNSQEDRDMKKILTVSALKFIQETDDSSIFRKLNDTQTASVVDTAYTSVKIAFKVADKSMTSDEAIDFLVDRGVARFESLVHSTCTKLGVKVGEGIGRVIGGVFGPAGSALGSNIGQVIGKMAGKKVGEIIVNGAKKLDMVAKEGLRKFASIAKQKFREGIKGFSPRIF